ncbi:potassium transporter, partial [Athelia psychrophila]
MSTLPAILEGGHTKREAVKLHGSALALLTFQTLGIIYSDIGTSPLYVLNGIWPSSGAVPSEEDVIGGISAIIWALTLLPLLKYVFISLHFGTHEGERTLPKGGTFALYQGLFPPDDPDLDDRTLTGDSYKQGSSKTGGSRRMKESFRWPLLAWCLFGTSLTIADSIFTPAVSVTSAVGGIAVAKPSIISDTVPISIAILVVLFVGQSFGTAKLGFMFSPVALVWFVILLATGIYNCTFYPGIFRAIDPSRAVMLFVRTKDYSILSGVLLAVTGCEAMFANLGHFNMLSIQISFSTFVFPSLVLAYLGQGARLIHDGEAVLTNIFYKTIPGPANGPLFWIVFVFAILATIIASQAMISATFSLIQQIITMKGLPPLRMNCTSEIIQGQIYIPAVNYTLLVAVIIVVAAFKSLTALTNAYGFAVATVMFSTTILIAIQMRYVKHLPWVVGLAYFVVFGFFDGLFWGAALTKVPKGAWVPLVIGVVLMLFMLFWTWAKRLEDQFDGANRRNLRHFILNDSGHQKETLSLSPNVQFAQSDASDLDEENEGGPSYYFLSRTTSGDVEGKASPMEEKASPMEERRELPRIPTCAIFHKLKSGKGVPHTFIGFIRQWPALPRVVIFLSTRVLPVARVPVEERYVVDKVRSVDGFYGVTYFVGFRDSFAVQISDIIDRICVLEVGADPNSCSEKVREIRQVAGNTTHMVPHYHVTSRRITGGKMKAAFSWTRAFLIEGIYRRLVTMFPETANWMTSADEIIHVGINATI